jgi:DNA-binding CsgD family transcriptional regulator
LGNSTTKEPINPYLVISILGFTCFLILGTLFFMREPPGLSHDTEQWMFLCRSVAALAMVIILLSPHLFFREKPRKPVDDDKITQTLEGTRNWRLYRILFEPSDSLLSSTPLLLSVVILIAPLPLLQAGMSFFTPLPELSLWLMALLWFLAGGGFALLIILFGNLCSMLFYHQRRKQVFFAICLAILTTGAICALFLWTGLSLLHPIQLSSILLLLLIASLLLCRYSEKHYPPIEAMSYQQTRDFIRSSMPLPMPFIRPMMAGFCFGSALFMLVDIEGTDTAFEVFSLLILLAGVGYGFANMLNKAFISVSVMDKFTHSCLCLAWVIIPFTNGVARFVTLLFIVFICLVFYAQHWCTIAQALTRHKINILHYFAFQTVFSVLGALLGCAYWPSLMGAGFPPQQIIILNSVITVFLFVVASAFVPYDNQLWDDLNNFMNGIEEVPLHEPVVAPRMTKRYREKCLDLAGKNGLTSRETEVFLLLAKGRNNEVISRELVISQHTSKTHIYHIYKKLGVGTQQELIDHVEDFES